MLNKGWKSARVLRRALILRQLDQQQTVTQVASQVGVARKTVRAIGRRYEEEGLESALNEKPRPGPTAGAGCRAEPADHRDGVRSAAARSSAVERTADR